MQTSGFLLLQQLALFPSKRALMSDGGRKRSDYYSPILSPMLKSIHYIVGTQSQQQNLLLI